MNRWHGTRHGEGTLASRRGAMLVLTIFFIVLAGSLAFLMMAGSAQLIRTTRHEHESILLRQMIDSGSAWARAHPGPNLVLPVTLTAQEIVPDGTSGQVTISAPSDSADTILVTARLSLPGREVTRTTRFARPS